MNFKQFENPISGTMWVAEDARGRTYIVLKNDDRGYTASTQSIMNNRGHTFHIIPYPDAVATLDEAQSKCREYERAH